MIRTEPRIQSRVGTATCAASSASHENGKIEHNLPKTNIDGLPERLAVTSSGTPAPRSRGLLNKLSRVISKITGRDQSSTLMLDAVKQGLSGIPTRRESAISIWHTARKRLTWT
jgi:hypothetical protein